MAKNKKSSTPPLPAEFLEKLRAVTAKRPRTMIDHILEHGYVTTEELKEKYGYDHAARAARDVRELGIQLETFRVPSSFGRKIAAYRFSENQSIAEGRKVGRKSFPKAFKSQLVTHFNSCCSVCSISLDSRYLQIDHRVPYEVAGEGEGELKVADYMVLCASCNRAKSWTCEHCDNLKTLRQDAGDYSKVVRLCRSCFWHDPLDYLHIALRDIRRLDIVWEGAEVRDYESLRKIAKLKKTDIMTFVKDILRKNLEEL